MHALYVPYSGLLSAVGDLKCVASTPCCFVCSWTKPYSLPGVHISGFNVNITSQQSTVTNKTTLQYCPPTVGVYIISVSGVNSAGEGVKRDTQIKLPQSQCISKLSCMHAYNQDLLNRYFD